jgi:PTS system nitrogen regulatory IIA component
MPLIDLIAPHQVIAGLHVKHKAQLLWALAELAARDAGVDAPILLEALQARERLGSTGMGNGFALPHARLRPLHEAVCLFARLARPIPFEAVDGQPVDLVCLLLTPEGDADSHLATLARLARPMRDADFRTRLREAADADEIYGLLASV